MNKNVEHTNATDAPSRERNDAIEQVKLGIVALAPQDLYKHTENAVCLINLICSFEITKKDLDCDCLETLKSKIPLMILGESNAFVTQQLLKALDLDPLYVIRPAGMSEPETKCDAIEQAAALIRALTPQDLCGYAEKAVRLIDLITRYEIAKDDIDGSCLETLKSKIPLMFLGESNTFVTRQLLKALDLAPLNLIRQTD